MKIKSINYNNVTINPIENFYNKLKNELPILIDDLFKGYYEKYKDESINYSNYIKNIDNNLINLKRKRKELKITLRKIQNIFIILGCGFLVGFFFLKKYKENRKIIKKFNDFKNNIINSNSELENEKKLSLERFFYEFNLTNFFKQISNQMGLGYRNYLYKKEYEIISKNLDPLWIDNAHVFLYKTSPIIDLSYKILDIRDVTTSSSRTFSYTDHIYEDGRYKTVIRNETLTAFHNEPTPFIDDYENLMFLTNFQPNFNFTIKNKKFLKLENDNFSKIYKINNNENIENAYFYEFFTVKAQEDYVNWYKLNNKKIIDNFSKNEHVIDITMTSYSYNSVLNRELNNFSLIDFSDNIENNINKLKSIIKEYFENLLNSMTYPLISPMINREAFNSKDYNYRIFNNLTDDNKILNEKIDYNYLDFYSIITKIYKPNFINFIKSIPKKPEWINIQNVNKYEDYYLIDCYINSYDSKHLIDTVLVSGRSGTHYIDVPYEKFYPIKEHKQIFFIPIEVKNIPNFSISHFLNFTISSNNSKFVNSWLNGIPFWTNNINYFDQTKNQEIIDVVKTISKNLPISISIMKIEEGIAIINNNINDNNKEFIDIIKKTIYRLSNL